MRYAILAVLWCLPAAAAHVYVLNGDDKLWQQACSSASLQCTMLTFKDLGDASLLAIEKQVTGPGYLVGVAGSAPAALYLASRMPHLWIAAALAGAVTPALQTNRVYAANFKNLPVLLVDVEKSDLERLQRAGLSVQTRDKATVGDLLQWFAQQHRDANPADIDCETGDPSFSRCYWLKLTKFDPKLRNDVLPSTRVPAELKPRIGANLLAGDQVVSIGGKPPDEFLASVKQDGPVTLMVQRGKERVRVEGKVVIPIAEEVTTTRIQATYNVQQHEIQIISRLVSALQITVPADWAPASVNWNGNEGRKLEAGCWTLEWKPDTVGIAKCQ